MGRPRSQHPGVTTSEQNGPRQRIILVVGILLGIALIAVGTIFIVSREQMKRGLQNPAAEVTESAADRAFTAPGRWMVASRLRTGIVSGLFIAFGFFIIVVVPT